MFTVTITYNSNSLEPAYEFDRLMCMERATMFFHGKFKLGSDTFNVITSRRELSFVFKKQYNAIDFQTYILREGPRSKHNLSNLEVVVSDLKVKKNNG